MPVLPSVSSAGSVVWILQVGSEKFRPSGPHFQAVDKVGRVTMQLSCEEIAKQYLATISNRFTCEPMDNHLRVITPYLYPNNDLIEVFVQERPPGTVRVTDLGETLRHLHSQGFDAAIRPQRRDMVEVIASTTGVDVVFGQLTKIGPFAELGDILFDVIVAARGVSDLIYTSRVYEPATFVEEVGQFLQDNGLDYDSSVKLTGQTGRRYAVQFMLHRGPVYLEPLSPRHASRSRAQVNSVFRMWSDCNGGLGKDRKITMLNDVDVRWRPDDIALLGGVSTVLNWSRRRELVSKLAPSA